MRQFYFSKIFLFYLFFTIIFITNCTNYDITDPGPQPIHMEDVEHQPKLNVLGILRPDSANSAPLSFIHIEGSCPINDIPDSSIIPDAEVKVIKFGENSPVDTSVFIYTDLGIFPTKEYRNSSFFPGQGTYQLVCKKDGYPTLTAQATIPAIPQIEEGTLKLQKNTLAFKITRDEDVGLYEVVLQGKGWLVKDRFLRPTQGNIAVEFSLIGIPKGECFLKIYAFDNNLSEYFTVNLSIKPNIYQKDFSTVENGYGSFGALNIFEIIIDL